MSRVLAPAGRVRLSAWVPSGTMFNMTHHSERGRPASAQRPRAGTVRVARPERADTSVRPAVEIEQHALAFTHPHKGILRDRGRKPPRRRCRTTASRAARPSRCGSFAAAHHLGSRQRGP
jgi:hypothetical protein